MSPGFIALLERGQSEGTLPEEQALALSAFYSSYTAAALRGGCSEIMCETLLINFLEQFLRQLEAPQLFSLHHKPQLEPFNSYRFALEFMRQLVNWNDSTLSGRDELKRIEEQLAAGENVIFLANHQTEPDAQLLHLFFEKAYPLLCSRLAFVAGHRVTTDPWAVPLSLGCQLLCIWSKKYMEGCSPEEKRDKLEHNYRVIGTIQQLLDGGGVALYVAPSGGRDRPDSSGRLQPALFDPQSTELFFLSARQSSKPTHIYPMALSTYGVMPPPVEVIREIGEPRHVYWVPIHLAIGQEWRDIAAVDKIKRLERSQQLHATVCSLYNAFPR